MRVPLVVAAILTGAVGLAHSYLGERYVIRRLLRRPDLPRLLGSDAFTRQIIRFAWHLTTVAWIGLAVVMLALADHFGNPHPATAILQSRDPDAPMRLVGAAVVGTFAVSAVITAVATRGRHLAWIGFAAIAALTWVGV